MKRISLLMLIFILTSPSYGEAPADQWRKDVIGKVAEHRTTPRSAQLRGAHGVARMAVVVDGNGMITGYRLVGSSGAPILDREADLILMRVGSFSPPPGRRPATVEVPIRW